MGNKYTNIYHTRAPNRLRRELLRHTTPAQNIMWCEKKTIWIFAIGSRFRCASQHTQKNATYGQIWSKYAAALETLFGVYLFRMPKTIPVSQKETRDGTDKKNTHIHPTRTAAGRECATFVFVAPMTVCIWYYIGCTESIRITFMNRAQEHDIWYYAFGIILDAPKVSGIHSWTQFRNMTYFSESLQVFIHGFK